METFRYLSNVTSLALDESACVGCGQCEAVCPHGVVAVENGKARIVDRDGCMECGACALNCPTQALAVRPGVGCAAYIIKAWLQGKNGGGGKTAACC